MTTIDQNDTMPEAPAHTDVATTHDSGTITPYRLYNLADQFREWLAEAERLPHEILEWISQKLPS